MRNKKIIIAGGTGFIGQEICNYFGYENEIIILTRQVHDKTNTFGEFSIKEDVIKNIRFVKWDGVTISDWAKEIEHADLVINLAGKTVNCRYTEKNKKEIFDSRTKATKAIGMAIQNAANPPKLWINAASATIYRHATDKPQDEFTGEYHNDFSVQVCKLWEKTFFEHYTPDTRKVALRMAITLGAGGVMNPYFNLLKFALGGRQGNGNQMYSWIYIEDTCRMIDWIFEHTELEGVYNCCSPNPVSNKYFMDELRKETGHVIGVPAFTWMLKIGAKLIGTETELILKSRWVLPTKILQTGFQFKYPLLPDAFKEIIKKTPRKKYHLF